MEASGCRCLQVVALSVFCCCFLTLWRCICCVRPGYDTTVSYLVYSCIFIDFLGSPVFYIDIVAASNVVLHGDVTASLMAAVTP